MELRDLLGSFLVKMIIFGLAMAARPVALSAPAGLAEMTAAPGPFVHPTPQELARTKSFPADKPIVGTYYFYWYDVRSGDHIFNEDGSDALVDHPPTMEDFSYRSVRWHEKQLRDMLAAGIDFLLPVYWGAPDGSNSWSNEGLGPLVKAWEKLALEGLHPPRIALFYDTSTLQYNRSATHVDLSTEEGKRWFYATVRDFYSQIPPKAWFAIEGRPVVWLYSAAFAAKQEESALAFLREQFAADFGCPPYIVKEVSWQGQADNTYQWGGAIEPKFLGVAALGPGYDDRAVPGRKHIVVARENGEFYRRAWETLLSRQPEERPRIAMVETWNELHEGTDICETREYGRQYIELTAKYAGLFKAP